ncbi:MAG: hypothetical protein LKE36_04530 [Bacilli bacterium]|jgi:putative aldouronate transport system substrate-binding protein|nr:hypothetical protein [Bacilli bacterium]
MKKRITKVLSNLGSLAFILSFLAGCGTTTTYDAENFLLNGTEDNPYRIVKDPVTIKIFAPHSAGNPEYKDLTMFKYLSQITGLNFEFTTPDTSAYSNQRASVWKNSSGLPDLFLFNNAVSEQVQYLELGYDAYVPFNDDNYQFKTGSETIAVGNIIENYMPNYKAGLIDNFGVDSEKEDAKKVATLSDGKMYATLSVSDVARDLTFKMFVNQKWIDNINNNYGGYNGQLLPAADQIKTVEQYLNVLRAFKNLDANDNGKTDDEIPVTSKSLEYLRNFVLASYGYVSQGAEIENDQSQFTYVPYTVAYRKYLQFMNTLWSEGLLHNSTFSITTDNQMAQYGTQNRLGSFVSAAAYLTVGYDYESDYQTFGPLTSSYYTGTPLQWGFGSFKADGACIPQKSPYVREVARLLDIMYSPLGAQLISYGVEGVDWTWDDANHTSWTFNVPDDWTGNQEQYRATITPNVGSASALYWANDFVGKMNDPIIMKLNEMSEIYRPYLKNPEPGEIKLNSNEYSQITTIKASLDPQLKYLEASYIRGDNGKDPFDDNSWQSFVSDLKGFGADNLIKCYNDALTRYKQEA